LFDLEFFDVVFEFVNFGLLENNILFTTINFADSGIQIARLLLEFMLETLKRRLERVHFHFGAGSDFVGLFASKSNNFTGRSFGLLGRFLGGVRSRCRRRSHFFGDERLDFRFGDAKFFGFEGIK